MKLASLIQKDKVLVRIPARQRQEALEQMLNAIARRGGLKGQPGGAVSVEHLLRVLLEREAKGTTNLGQGIGFPHVRCEGFSDVIMALATAPQGVQYGPPGSDPVRLIVLAVVPPDKNALLLGIMACLSRIAETPSLREGLISAKDAEEALRLLHEADLEVTESLVARDIMKRQVVSVPLDMSLRDVALTMHAERLDALPVVDDKSRLRGQVAARDLFRACLPRYFAELPSMRFARNFDPFEHFLRDMAHVEVRQILSDPVHAVDPQTPLAEVVARLARQDVSALYVVEDERLVGVIDGFSIIDKILAL